MFTQYFKECQPFLLKLLPDFQKVGIGWMNLRKIQGFNIDMPLIITCLCVFDLIPCLALFDL